MASSGFADTTVYALETDVRNAKVPHLLVHVQHQILASLRKIPERGRAAQLYVGRTATGSTCNHRNRAGLPSMRTYRYSPRFFSEKKPREDRRVTFGG